MKILLRTFGCRANRYDSEQVRAMLARSGAELTDDPAEADVAIFNSCAVTTAAEAELRHAVRATARVAPAVRTLVTGCAASRSREALAALPGVSDVIPGADLEAVARALALPPSVALATAGEQSGARAVLRVQDGCDEHCTFCATTLARGAHRSRTADELVREARTLAERHGEIVLTGMHVGSWGKESGQSLGALVARLVRDVPSARFRLASVEATEVDDELRELLRDGGDRVCPYLHAPLQSGSDAVLRRMGRHWYTAATYAREVRRLVDGREAFGLGADLVTGFPGETDADHALTVSLVRELPFTHLHVFPYSPRPGTAALRLPAPVPTPIARARAAELRALGDEKAAAYRARRIGRTATVAVISGATPREGLTEDYLPVVIAGAMPARGTLVRATLEAPVDPSSRLVARP